jgi:hypothetical protein
MRVMERALGNDASERRHLLLIAAFLQPFHGRRYAASAKQTSVPLLQYLLRDALLFSKADIRHVQAMHDACAQLGDCVARGFDTLPRSHYGMLLRAAGAHWQDALRLCACVATRHLANDDDDDERTAIERRYLVELRAHIVDTLGLVTPWQMRPLVTGKQLFALLDTKPGPHVTSIMSKQIVWLFDHPNATHDQCAQYLQTLNRSTWQTATKKKGKKSKQ